jgi:FkbM family methyltransferase
MLIDFRQLFPRYNIKPKGVLHIGANIGEEAPVYLELGIHNQFWIEANPEIFTRLQQNVSGNQFAECWNYCISDVDGEKVNFHVSNNGSQSSSILELGTHKTQHPDVHYVKDIPMETIRIDTLFKNNFSGLLDFLNIDLQGAELKALKGMGDLLNQFKWVYLEVNSDHVYEGCALLPEIEEYLSQFGFKRAELKWASANLTWGDCLFIK